MVGEKHSRKEDWQGYCPQGKEVLECQRLKTKAVEAGHAKPRKVGTTRCSHRNGQGSHPVRLSGFLLLLEEQVSKGKSNSKHCLHVVLELRTLSGPLGPTPTGLFDVLFPAVLGTLSPKG